MQRSIPTLAILLVLLAGTALAEDAPGLTRAWVDPLAVPRGPVEIRDEFIPAQLRLTLPATSPDAVGRGRWRLRATFNWGSDFSFSQTGSAEDPRSDRRYLVDGEHRTIELAARYGLADCLDVGIRVPIQWRGAGSLDGFIDWFHENFPSDDNDRPYFYRDKYRVEGRDAYGEWHSWTDSEGTGLGNVELMASWAFRRPRNPRDLRLALVGRLGLPTGTGPFETGSVDLGLQVAAAKQLARRWDLYGGCGGTWYSDPRIRGFEYVPFRAYGFMALEFRPWRRLSVLLQSDYGSRLISNLREYPGVQWYIHAALKYDFGRCWRGVLGFTENFIDQQSTLDVGMWAGLETSL